MSSGPYIILESQGAEHVPLSAYTDFGRGEENAVVLRDIGVSTRHAAIRKDGAFWVVEDLSSTNGTWLNHKRVDGPTVIKEGDQLQMGSQRIRVAGFRVGLGSKDASAAPTVCPRCSKGLPSAAAFCPSCGLPIAATTAGVPSVLITPTIPFPSPYLKSAPPAQDSNRKALVIGLAVLGAIVLILSVAVGWMLRDKAVRSGDLLRGNLIQQS